MASVYGPTDKYFLQIWQILVKMNTTSYTWKLDSLQWYFNQ